MTAAHDKRLDDFEFRLPDVRTRACARANTYACVHAGEGSNGESDHLESPRRCNHTCSQTHMRAFASVRACVCVRARTQDTFGYAVRSERMVRSCEKILGGEVISNSYIDS